MFLFFKNRLIDSYTLFYGKLSVRLPDVKYDMETANYTVNETETKQLVLSESCPVATTCSLFDELVFFMHFHVLPCR